MQMTKFSSILWGAYTLGNTVSIYLLVKLLNQRSQKRSFYTLFVDLKIYYKRKIKLILNCIIWELIINNLISYYHFLIIY